MVLQELPKLTTKDMQDIFKVDRSTIYKWRKAGLPYYKLGGYVRFKESEVMAWVEQSKATK